MKPLFLQTRTCSSEKGAPQPSQPEGTFKIIISVLKYIYILARYMTMVTTEIRG